MATENPESTGTAVPKASNPNKLVIILCGVACLLSVVNTALLLLNPTAGKVEQFNESLKSDVAESVAAIDTKIEGLKSAEIEWQAVLKKSSEKPDAVYKIFKSADGLLTLAEIERPTPDSAK